MVPGAAPAVPRHRRAARPAARAAASVLLQRGRRVRRARLARGSRCCSSWTTSTGPTSRPCSCIEHMAALMPELRVLGVGTYRDVELEVSGPLAAAMERLVRARAHRPDRGQALRPGDGRDDARGARGQAARPTRWSTPSSTRPRATRSSSRRCSATSSEEGQALRRAASSAPTSTSTSSTSPRACASSWAGGSNASATEAQKVLAAGAVVGRGFPFRLLEAITDIDAGRLLDIVEEAEAARGDRRPRSATARCTTPSRTSSSARRCSSGLSRAPAPAPPPRGRRRDRAHRQAGATGTGRRRSPTTSCRPARPPTPSARSSTSS